LRADTKRINGRLLLILVFVIWLASGAAALALEPAHPANTKASATPAPTEDDRLKRIDDDLSVGLSILWKLVLACGFPLGVWWLRNEWRREALVIEPFEVPKDLQDIGISGTVMSQLLADHIFQLQRNASVEDDPADLVFVELPRLQLDLQMPGTGWSVRAAIRYFKHALGQVENRLLGEVVRNRGAFVLRLRLSSGRACEVPKRFHGPHDLDAALRSAADSAMLLLDPLIVATIRNSSESYASGYAGTLEALRQHLARAPAAQHQWAYVLWASVHKALGEFDAMEEKLRQAQMVGASVWRGQQAGVLGPRYRNFVGNLHRERLEFAAAEAQYALVLRADPKNIAALNNLGLLLGDWWRFEEAVSQFHRIIRFRPNSSRGYRGLGLIASRSYRLDEALQHFSRAIDIAPLARWPRINLIETLRSKGDFPAAFSAIAELEKIDPAFPPLLRTWGDVLMESGSPNEAEAKLEQAVALGPFDAANYASLARVRRVLGKTDPAIADAEQALALRPQMPAALNLLALLKREKGEFEAALDLFTKRKQVAPHDPWAYTALAEELRKRNRYTGAREVLLAAPAHCQLTPDYLRALGALLRERDPLAALRYFDLAIEAAPCEQWAYLDRAAALRKLGRYDEARQAVEQARGLRPGLPNWRLALGDILADQRALREAEQVFRDAVQYAPHEPGGYTGLTNVLRMAERFDEAVEVIKALLARRPNLPTALQTWGEVLRDQGDLAQSEGKLQQAEAKLREAIAADPYSPWPKLELADVLRRLGEYKDALALIHDVMDARPDMPDALLRWGEVLRDQDKCPEAEQKFRQAIEIAPCSPWPYLRVAELRAKADDLAGAIRTLESLQARRPNHPNALSQWAKLLAAVEDWTGAEAQLKAAIAAVPTSPFPLIELAYWLRKRDRREEAIAAVEHALELCPGLPKAVRASVYVLRA
jgi:superkiller protein 3